MSNIQNIEGQIDVKGTLSSFEQKIIKNINDVFDDLRNNNYTTSSDKDGDGDIDDKDYLMDKFGAKDLDKDGYISPKELVAGTKQLAMNLNYINMRHKTRIKITTHKEKEVLDSPTGQLLNSTTISKVKTKLGNLKPGEKVYIFSRTTNQSADRTTESNLYSTLYNKLSSDTNFNKINVNRPDPNDKTKDGNDYLRARRALQIIEQVNSSQWNDLIVDIENGKNATKPGVDISIEKEEETNQFINGLYKDLNAWASIKYDLHPENIKNALDKGDFLKFNATSLLNRRSKENSPNKKPIFDITTLSNMLIDNYYNEKFTGINSFHPVTEYVEGEFKDGIAKNKSVQRTPHPEPLDVRFGDAVQNYKFKLNYWKDDIVNYAKSLNPGRPSSEIEKEINDKLDKAKANLDKAAEDLSKLEESFILKLLNSSGLFAGLKEGKADFYTIKDKNGSSYPINKAIITNLDKKPGYKPSPTDTKRILLIDPDTQKVVKIPLSTDNKPKLINLNKGEEETFLGSNKDKFPNKKVYKIEHNGKTYYYSKDINK